ncbi:MAG: plasmid mobilization relaxosome protein MobC [Mobilitalea sp.]
MENRKRNIQIKFRVSKQESYMIRDRMNLVGISDMGKYLRHMSIDGCVLKVDYSSIKNISYEINKIGTNINQIAYKVNSTDKIHSEEIQQLKEMLDVIWQYQKSILSEEP